MNFDGFCPFTTWKTDDRTLFFVGACCKLGRHLYTTTSLSCCIPAAYYHMSATLQTMTITAVNLQDNQAVFRIFIALLMFSFDAPSYIPWRPESLIIPMWKPPNIQRINKLEKLRDDEFSLETFNDAIWTAEVMNYQIGFQRKINR